MFKAAHISDVHITFKDENENGIKFIELLKDIKSRNCDHIFLTGDIVDNTELKDFMYAREILSHFGLLDPDKLSVVTGNHDIYGAPAKGPTFFFYSLNCKENHYNKSLDLFIETFKDTFPSNNSFPYLKKIKNLAVIGINSIDRWSLKKNPEGSNGRISDEDFEKLEEILRNDDIKNSFKVVLIHHHFNRADLNDDFPGHSMWLKVINWKMRLYNKKKILKLFKKYNVNLVLHGHTHTTDVYNLKKISIVNSSACVMPLTDDQVKKYNIIYFPEEQDNDRTIKVETITLG